MDDLRAQITADSIFICATDVVIGNRVNSEFCFETDLLEYLGKSFDIYNNNMIVIDGKFYRIESCFSEFFNFNFK